MKTFPKILLVAVFVSLACFAGWKLSQAQDTTMSAQYGTASLTDTNVNWSFASDLEVELRGLELTTPIPASELPDGGMGGTFWSAQHAEDWPPLPGDILGLPVWPLGGGVFVLDDTNVNYVELEQPQTAGGMRAMDEGSGGGFSPDFSFPTNGFWLRINGVSNGLAYLTLYGTTNGVEYQILSQNALSNAPMPSWNVEGSLFWGSATTNWTATTVTQNGRTNLFMAARSWVDSAGSGIPDWWWLQYFGQSTNVDPYGDPKGDGWNNLEKFQFGMNPNQFYTPPAPQVTVTFNSANSTATLSWLPSPGPVTGYTVTVTDYTVANRQGVTTTNNLSAGTDDFEDDLSGDPLFNPGDFGIGPLVYADYQVVAHYSGGDSAPGSAQLQNLSAPDPTVISGAQGNLYLAMPGLPADLSAIRVFSYPQGMIFGDSDYNLYEDGYFSGGPTNSFMISASNVVNGICPLPTSQIAPFGDYWFYVQTVRSNGVTSGWAGSIFGENDRFVDARSHLKDNLRFILRSASGEPFAFTVYDQFIGASTFRFWPTNYVYAGFYSPQGSGTYAQSFDPLEAVEDNNFYRNFVFDQTNLNSDGTLKTGDYYDTDYTLYITNSQYYFDLATLITQTNPVVGSSVLSSNQTGWLTPPSRLDTSHNVSSGAKNVYGLSYLSAENAYNPGGQLVVTLRNPGDSAGPYLYYNTAQPIFQTVNYYFARPNFDPMPEQNNYSYPMYNGAAGFSPTNTTPLLIASVGNTLSLVGYAKMTIQNGNTNLFAYLGQYFDQAYQINTNGVVATNSAGVLSPYGDFFPTVPGPAALVTMPDVDPPYQRGTCTVYAISLAVDANHDGIMDISFGGADATSPTSPMNFWADNNYDRNVLDQDDNTNYDDDVAISDPTATCPYTPNAPTSDCNYRDFFGQRVIPTARDLEDFARLWVCGVTLNLLAALPPNSTVTLNWGDVGSPNSANPTIDLFQAADPNGNIGYLTNAAIATAQINPAQSAYINRLAPGGSIQLNVSQLGQSGNWLGNYFIWCGVSNGTGQLNLTIADGSGNVLAQASQWVQIKDIKDMYERWTVGDRPSVSPKAVATNAANDLPDYLQLPFRYATNTDADTSYILLVHGWNDDTWVKDRFAETAFKRLYWQGYQGRFGSFRWPTDYDFNATLIDAILQPHNYDGSEFTAWQSAVGLLNKLENLNAEYPDHVYVLAHSMGNVVAGEALRLAAQNGDGQLVNTYVGSQAAIPAHVYDATVTSPYLIDYTYVAHGDPAPGYPKTPNIYGNRLTNNAVAVGRRISFYNVNDYALNADAWCFDQEHKPDTFLGGYYFYNGSLNDPAPWNNFQFVFTGIDPPPSTNLDIVNIPENLYEVLAYAANPYSTALGATPVTTLDGSIDMTDPNNHIWPATDPLNNSYKSHFWHSAQFRGDAWLEWNYWKTLLRSSTLGFNISNQ